MTAKAGGVRGDRGKPFGDAAGRLDDEAARRHRARQTAANGLSSSTISSDRSPDGRLGRNRGLDFACSCP